MSDKSILKKIFNSKYYLPIGFVALLFVGFAFARAYYQNYQVRQTIHALQEKTSSMESRNFDLEKYLKYAKSDDFVEEKARTELNMVKDGENVIQINGSEKDFARQNTSEVVKSDTTSNPRKWWNYFFKNN